MLSVWSWLRCDVVVQRLWTLWSSGWERSSSKFPTSKTLNGTMINISTDIFVWKKRSGSHDHSSSSPLVCFNHIKEGFVINVSSGEPQADFSHLQQPFDTPAFNKLYRGQTPFVIMMIIKVVMLGFFFCILYTCSRVSLESDLIKPSYWTCWYILMCLLQLFLWGRFTLWPSAGPYRRRGNTTGESSTASYTCTGAEGG